MVDCTNGVYSHISINHWSKESTSAFSAVTGRGGAGAFWFPIFQGEGIFCSSTKKLQKNLRQQLSSYATGVYTTDFVQLLVDKFPSKLKI